MNKRLIALLSATMIMVALLVPAFASVEYAYVKTANYGPLNMRADTSVNSDKIGSIPYGKQVVVLDYFVNNTWASVDYNGKEGYVMTRYLSFTAPSLQPGSSQPGSSQPATSDLSRMFDGFQSTEYTAAVRPSTPGGFVHMRWAPSKQMGIMEDFFDGKQLDVLAQNNTWCQVRDPETQRTGFMMRSFLQQIAYGYGYGAAEE